jgi:hypothetical protein
MFFGTMNKNSVNVSFKSIILFICLTCLTSIIFQINLFSFSSNFSDFQKDSEALIIGSMIADDFGVDKKGANLGFVAKGNEFKYPDNILDAYTVFSEGTGKQNIVFIPYKSGYGIQGIAFSKIHHFFGLNKLSQLQSLNSILLALIIVSLFFVYRKIYNVNFAIIFLLTMISSPWIVSFAKNLFWVSFLWFTPALFAAVLYQQTKKTTKAFLLLAIFIAVFVKSLAGYEYLSSITLFTCSVFVVAPFFRTEKRSQSIDWVMFSLVFAACVLGFAAALLVHAGIKGDSIISGLQNIFEQDVKRRTYGDPSLLAPVYRESLESTVIEVLKKYVLYWNTDLILWLPGNIFKILIGFSLVSLCYKFCAKHETRQRDFVVFVFFLMIPVSWYVLAKGHSYIHTHINFVLWYFGFIQALVYITVNSATIFCLNIIAWVKPSDVKDY